MMKKRFTFLIAAAVMLLTMMATTGTMWGQTRTTQTSVIDFETGEDQSDWTITKFKSITPSSPVEAYHGQKIASTDGQSTDAVTTKNAIASPQSLTCYYTKLSTNTNASSKFLIQISSNGSTWTTVATGNTMNNVTQGTWYELSADLSSYSDVYVQVKYDGTSANRGLDYITLTYDDGSAPSTDPEISFTPGSIALGEVLVGTEVSTTFSVSQANLESGISLSVDNGNLSPSSIDQGASATTVTWTYTPSTAGDISATVTATSGQTSETLAISGTAIAPVEGYDVDFEYATNMYPNWTFDNMTTYQTGSITAHGGTYYGTTGGKATASITTTSTVANPGTLTCYVSKQSNNTTSSTWYIQVSSNGSSWTEVESHSATSMSQGSWVEFSADLSSYTDVYVRVYYSGSTAIRNIDDLTLTTATPSTDPSISADDVEIAYNATSGSIMYEIENYVAGTMVATTTADWISDFTYEQDEEIGEVGFTATVNNSAVARTATVTLTYTYDSRQTITKDVTITQTADPNYVMTIAEARAQATGSSVCTQGIVTSISGSSAFIQDATAAINVYGNSTLVVGQKYKVSGTLDNYNGLLEITDPTCTLVEGGSVIAPEVMTIADILTSNNQGWFIKIEGATVGTTTSNGNTTLTQGESSIVARNLSGAEEGDVINLTGNISVYNSTKQIANPLVVADPSITVDEDEITLTYQVGATEAPQETLIVEGSNLQGPVTVSLTGSNFKISGDGTTWGTADITLTPTGGTLEQTMIGVMLNTGLEHGTYTGSITLTSTNVETVITLTGTVTNQTYTLTDESGDNGSISFSASAAEAGAHVTLTATPASDAYYFVPNSWSFFKDDLTVVTEDIEFVAGETNVIVMPAYNLHVDVTFQLKQTYAITAVALPEAGGTVVTDVTAWEGKVVEIAVEAAAGYALSSLTATYVDGDEETQELTITDNTFVMPAYAVTVTATFEENTEVTYDFTEIDFTDWTNSYAQHIVEYETATVTFVSASHQTGTITNQPVTKGSDVIIVMKNGLTLSSAAFECTQWGSKTQAIELHYSTDGGETYTSTGVTSDDFSISSILPTGTNAVKITFSSANQVGIASATVNIQNSDIQAYTLKLGDLEHINEYFVFVNNQNESVEFDENDEIEVYEGATVYVSVAEVEDCYLFNGINVVYGDNQKADTTKYDPMYYSFVMPAGDATLDFHTSEATQYTLTVAGSHFEFDDLLVGSESDVVTLDANNQAEICEQLYVQVDGLTIEEGYVLTSVTLAYGAETFNVTTNEGGLYEFQMPSSDAILTITTDLAPVADNYELFSGDLVEGDYLIVYNEKAMNNTVDGDRLQFADVTATNNVITTDNAAIVWHIAPSDDYWTIYSADANAYAASTGVKNKAQMLADGTDDKALWAVSGTETYEFVNKQNAANSVNANLRKNGSYGFACYATSTGGALSLYKKVEDTPVTETYTLDNITGYFGEKDYYYLIASPVTVDPESVDGMTDGDFDLYYFDESVNDEEWQNYKVNEFNLVPGKGYLYAKKATVNTTYSFELTGIPYAENGEIPLSYTEGNRFAGWNLIGNPFGAEAVLDKDFYRLTENGFSALVSENRTVNAMEGVFVVATEDGEYATFAVPEEPGQEGFQSVALNVVRDRAGIIDRAIVRIGEGRQLPKFQLNANNTKIYITEGNQDYAIVYSHNDAEIPVSFKAAERGTYTINVNVKNVEMTYLHLIDNRTGANVDLLANPNYSFEANKGDNASRFRLVFKTNSDVEDNTAAETFAYFNGSEWVISNPSTGSGSATLQVIDMMGRVLRSEQINGNTAVNINETAGIYMLRLVNGENVMVQKVVVR